MFIGAHHLTLSLANAVHIFKPYLRSVSILSSRLCPNHPSAKLSLKHPVLKQCSVYIAPLGRETKSLLIQNNR
jgi:hypothetical protein